MQAQAKLFTQALSCASGCGLSSWAMWDLDEAKPKVNAFGHNAKSLPYAT